MNRTYPFAHIDRKDGARVLSIKKQDNGNIEFREECDRYFAVALTPEQVVEFIETLQEMIDD